MPDKEWTIETAMAHLLVLREADQQALKIKEEADRRALELARENQSLRDEKANGLLDIVKSERGLYATKAELEPIKAYISSQTGRSGGVSMTLGAIISIVMLVATISGTAATVATLLLRR